jgi:hypothetical protein
VTGFLVIEPRPSVLLGRLCVCEGRTWFLFPVSSVDELPFSIGVVIATQASSPIVCSSKSGVGTRLLCRLNFPSCFPSTAGELYPSCAGGGPCTTLLRRDIIGWALCTSSVIGGCACIPVLSLERLILSARLELRSALVRYLHP